MLYSCIIFVCYKSFCLAYKIISFNITVAVLYSDIYLLRLNSLFLISLLTEVFKSIFTAFFGHWCQTFFLSQTCVYSFIIFKNHLISTFKKYISYHFYTEKEKHFALNVSACLKRTVSNFVLFLCQWQLQQNISNLHS